MVLLAVMLAASDVTVELSPGTPCLSSVQLSSALRARGLEVRDVAGPRTLVVHLSGRRDEVVVQSRKGSRRLERVVPAAPGDCSAVERVIVALLQAWAQPQRPQESQSGAAPRAPSEEGGELDGGTLKPEVPRHAGQLPEDARGLPPAPLRAGPPGGLRDAPAKPPPASSDVRVELPPRGSYAEIRITPLSPGQSLASNDDSDGGRPVPDAGGPPEVEAIAVDRVGAHEAKVTDEQGNDRPQDAGAPAPGPPAPAGVPAPQAMESVDVRPLRLEVGLLGGATVDTAAALTGAGSLVIRGAWARWGLLVEAGLESERSATLAPVTATASMQWLSLSASVGFEPASGLALDASLGVRGWRVVARARGADVALEPVELAWGASASLGLSYRLIGPLMLQARPFGSLRTQRLRFTVEPLGTVLELEPLTLGVLAGALLRFE